MQNQIIVTMIDSESSINNALLMISSIREFAGSMAKSTIWILIPQGSVELNDIDIVKFEHLKAKTFQFDVEDELRNFPFGSKVQAAVFAEELALNQSSILIWLNCDTLVLNDLTEFALAPDKVLGYRPVHHKLIGSSWEDTLDPFWTQIYKDCDTPISKDFAMITHIGEKIHPYFNAGTFVIRPEKKLLTSWWQVFTKCFRSSKFLAFYKTDQRYAIFMHQAVLTGVLLTALNPSEMYELNSKINYPLHLHHDVPIHLRPKTLNDLITIRHENIIGNPGWAKGLPIMDPLLSWLSKQLKAQTPPRRD